MKIYICDKCKDNQCILENNMEGQPTICPHGIVMPEWKEQT